MLPHRYRVQFGKRDPHKKLTGAAVVDRRPTLAERFMTFRRAALASQALPVDSYMRRGEMNGRFAYFDD